MSFKFYKQLDGMDCGPACLRMIAKYYGRNYKQQTLTRLCEINRSGASLLGVSDAAEKIGFRTLGVKIDTEALKRAELPCILHWRQYHFLVLYKIAGGKYYLADPATGLVATDEQHFRDSWLGDKEKGVVLMLKPTPKFYEQDNEANDKVRWGFLFRYLVIYRKLVLQLVIGLGIGSIMQLITPFLTQAVVDVGINTRSLSFITIILLAQIALILGRISVDFIRSWVLLHITTRVNISILTDFLIKLMALPMSFFDTKMTGDIMQRMNDQKSIQNFLTGSTLTTVFSLFNLFVFTVVLAYYNLTIFSVFLLCSALYGGWIALFLGRRRSLNYKSFDISAKNQSSIIQLINGMQEIKLNNCEQQKRWEWEHIQARLFKFNVKTLSLNQYQEGGATLINEGKNIFITFLSAAAVVNGQLTLGGMLAIQYIVGQLNTPVAQLLTFIQNFQDAKISLERLNEIHQMGDEEGTDKEWSPVPAGNHSLYLNELTFRYPGAGNEPVLKDISLHIPAGKTTAIVGMSGSGKTTILKLLLRFYEPQKGEIRLDDQSLSTIGYKAWRSRCGVVMQDGFIFSDTIKNNIALGDEHIDKARLRHAIRMANIQDLIEQLPMGIDTRIGAEGNGISQGQRQRILIARVVYKNPDYLFFDEATNSLDANNESVIMENLSDFFTGKTVVVVAHRLSTVKNADNIIVLDKGRIIEQGTHAELASLRGDYYRLVRNQLELGN